ncbi:hypothetical protein R1sor_008370 [Riccia sorocarpa]|uniref:FHA domain-containing protein n=1 Tax=Riccia sorocarpa TaxID=122646 RepID=A0ABD3HVF5_9MARC
MVITTPFITKYVEDLKPQNKLNTVPVSEITIVVHEKGVKDSWSKTFLDVHVMKNRLTIGRVRNCSLQIDDRNVSRLHAVIECNPKTGKWIFWDIESVNGSIVNGKRVKPKTTRDLEHNDKIKIDANRKSNSKSRRLPNTLVQKAVMRRGSYWWPKKPGEDEKKANMEIPTTYNDPPEQSVRNLPDYENARRPSTPSYPVFNPRLSI